MKLPWNKKYLIISFHIVVTLIMVYAIKYCIDFLAYVFSNLNIIFNNIKNGIGWVISIFSVVIIAFVISYLLDPVVEFFQIKFDIVYSKYLKNTIFLKKHTKVNKTKINKKIKEKDRLAGTLITYLVIILTFTILSWLLINSINKNGNGNLVENITTYVKNSVNGFQTDLSKFYKKVDNILNSKNIFEEYISPQVNKFIKNFTSFIYDIGNNLILIISSFTSGIINIIISLVIAFYFLKEKSIIKQKFENASMAFLPKKFYKFLKNSLGDINVVFSGYIRGTLLDASIMAILISILLSIIGLNFSILIGIISGFSNIIPYFGALMGFILAISVALISGEPMKALYSTIIILALQQIDTIFIAPKVIGESVELSPVLVIIALSVAGNLFGLWGMVFAVPVFATIKLFVCRIYERQKIKKNVKSAIDES